MLRSAPGPERTAEPADNGPVRKTVTVLFVDLVGSTAFQESVDPEAARGAMTRYYDMVQRVVDAHHGTVAKFQGDGALAVFGVPEVAEDDAVRAVSTGVALQQAFSEIRDYVSERYRVDVGLRVGINTGEVVIAAEDADLVGDVLNTAARLEAACTPGRVMVGEDTWRLTRSAITYEVLGEISVKGKVEPIGTFEVVEDAAFETPEDDTSTPFVGREPELATMGDAYRAARESATARLVTVIGAPGVGKTRLAAELVASLDEARAFDLRCERAGTSTFAPIADLLRSVADIGADQSGPQAEASVAAWLGDASDADRLQPLLSSFVGGTDTFSTEELFFGARRLVELVAADAPAVLVVDDIQWAEPLLLDLLEHLIEWVTDAPVLVVGLARPELRDIRPSLAEPGRRVQSVVSLEGLDAAATAELAARLVGADRLPVDLLARLPESTEGNPLFVRELMQMLVDDGVIARGPGGWALTIDAEAVEVPPTIQSLLSTRVERMPVDERRLVELAAVVGPDFARGAVAAIADGWTSSQVDDVFRRLERKELIEPTGSYWGNEPIYRFHHVLVRDAAYRRLLKGSRAELHLRVGEWTEQTASVLTGEHEVSVAHHFEQAFIYRRELGLDDDETTAAGTRAAALLTVAADRALARDDLPAAGSLALRAIDCLAADAADVPALLLTANEALLSSGDVARATSALEKLEAYADDEERLRQWATCFRGQLTVLADPAGLDVAADRLDDAAVTLDRLDDAAGVAKARQIRALALASLGRVGDCEAELDRALTAARKADDRRRVTAVLGAAPIAALWGPSPVPRAGGRCLDVIRLLRITTGSPAVEATSIRCQAVLEALRGRFDTARTMLGTARETAEEMGLRRDLMETEFYAGLVELLADDAVAAEPHLRRAYDGLDRLGIGADAGQAAAHLARALLIQGRIDEAEELAGTSDALAGQNTQTAIAARSVRAEVLSARGRHDEAVPLAQEAVAIASGTDILVDHAQALAALARVQAAAGLAAQADQAAASARALFDQKGATVEVDAVQADLGDERRPRERRWPEGNACTALVDGILGVLASGAIPAFDDLSPELVVEDHRTDVSFGTLDRASYEAQVESMTDVGAHPDGIEWLAVRAESTALGSLTMVYGDGYSRRLLAVYRTDEASLCDRIGFFDPDDIPTSYRRMEDWFLETLDPADREPWATIVEWVVAHNAGDVETMEAWMRLDLQVVDHGTLGWGSFDRETAVERFSETAGAMDYALPTAILRYGGGASLSSHRYQYRDGAAVEGYALTHNTTDTTHRAEYFDLDQLDLALRRFDEVTQPEDPVTTESADLGGDPATPDPDERDLDLANRATVEMGKLAEFFRAGDIAAGGELLTADFVRHDRRSGVAAAPLHGPDAMVTSFEALHALGLLADFHPRPIAIRGDDFALFDTTMAADESVELRVLQLVALRPGDKACSLDLFDAEDITGAIARLDELYLETLPPAEASVFETVRGHFAAVAAGDVDALNQVLNADAVIIDHQPLGWGRLTAAQYVDRMASLDQRTEQILSVVHAINENSAVFTAAGVQDGESVKLVHWFSRIEGGRHVVIESFGVDDLSRAQDRLEGIAAGSAPAGSNRCDGAVRELLRRAAGYDWDGVEAMIAADLKVTTQRTGPTVSTAEAGSFVHDGLRGYGELGFRVLDRHVVAVGGDDLVLARMRWATPDGDEIEWLAVEGVDDEGRLALLVQFDSSDLDAAHAEFDRISDRTAVEEHRSNRERLAEQCRDVGVELNVFSPDVRVEDRRRLVGVGEEPFDVRSLTVYVGLRPTTRFELIAEHEDRVMLHAQTITDRSTGWQSDFLALNRFDHDGMCDLLVLFDAGEVQEARREYERLTVSTRHDLAPAEPTGDANGAIDMLMALLHASADADPDGVMQTLSPHLERHDRRRGVSAPDMTNAEFAASTVELMRLRSEAPATHVVATRGNRIALAEGGVTTEEGFEIRFLILVVVGDEDLIERIENFDRTDVAAALARLDDLYAATLTPEDRQPFVRIARGIHARNAVATGRIAMVPPGASFTGEGAIEFPELEPDSEAARLLGAAELGGITVMQPVHVARDGAALVTMRTALDEGHVVRHFVFRRRNDDQLVVQYFDEDALGEAFRTVDTPPDHAAAAPAERPTNLATATSDRVSELVRNGVVDDLEDWWHPEASARDYSRLGGGAGGRDDFIEAMRSWREVWDIGQPDSGGPVSVKGDHAALVEYRFGTVGSWSVDRLAVLAVDDDGRITELTFYDHDDRDIAQAALDALDLGLETDVEAQASATEPAPASRQPTNVADRLARQHGVLVDGEVVAVLDTLGVRLDDFALHRVNGPGEETALALSCWTNGELVTAQRFDEFDVQKAYFELDEWAGETLPPKLWRSSPIRRWAKATQEQDWATCRELLDPNYEAQVHQLLGPEAMSGDALVRWFESLENSQTRMQLATPELHAMSDVGGIVWEEFEQIDTDGFAVSNGGISVTVARNGLLVRSTRFDDGQLAEAMALLEEIAEDAGAEDSIVWMSESARALRPGP